MQQNARFTTGRICSRAYLVTASQLGFQLGDIVLMLYRKRLESLIERTRLYSQPLDSHGKGVLYDGALDCAWKILRIEGVLAFYKGATAHFLRVGPHTMLTFVFIGLLRRNLL